MPAQTQQAPKSKRLIKQAVQLTDTVSTWGMATFDFDL
jgi:hypothetical protein